MNNITPKLARRWRLVRKNGAGGWGVYDTLTLEFGKPVGAHYVLRHANTLRRDVVTLHTLPAPKH